MVRMHPVLSLVAPVAMIAAESASIVPRTLSVDGVDRFALVHEPGTAAEAGPAPLVLWFHGHGGSATAGVQRHALHRHWPEAVVAYPQGLATPGKTDPAGVKSGWQRFPGDQGDRDLRFADRLVAELSARPGGIDPTRIYACGHSNGGGFTILLWSQRPWFAAVAPASCGGVPGRDAVPVLFIASRQDQVVPFATQERSLDAEKKRYENGMSSSFEITRIQQDLTAAKSRQVNAIIAYRTAVTQLQQATAQLLQAYDVTIDDPEAPADRWDFSFFGGGRKP